MDQQYSKYAQCTQSHFSQWIFEGNKTCIAGGRFATLVYECNRGKNDGKSNWHKKCDDAYVKVCHTSNAHWWGLVYPLWVHTWFDAFLNAWKIHIN